MKKGMLVLAMGCVLLMTGCAGKKKIEECILQFSGITEDEAFRQAQELQGSGLVNEAGEYEEETYTELSEELRIQEENEQKQVHVTIAENQFLDIDYFLDSARTQKLQELNVYLNPGDRLYCSQPESRNDSNAYVFSEFRIYEYDEEGKKGELYDETGGESLVLEIPKDYQGKELSVIPVGKYEKQGLTFRAFYYDRNGSEKNVSGVWSVDDVVYTENEVEIDAGKPYTVRYEYDKDTYYYVEASPAPFAADQPGVVEFKKTDSESNYSVILHPYLSAEFFYDSDKKGIASVSVNNRVLEAGEEIPNLRAGDLLTVTTSEDYRMFCSSFPLGDPEKVEDGYRYTMTVPDGSGEALEFLVAKSELEIVLDKSVGVDTLFDITASGLEEKNRHYSADAGKNLTIFKGSIGIEENVPVTAREGVLDAGNVLKVEIEKTDGNDERTEETKYIEALPGTAEIALYDKAEEMVNPDKIFRSVRVKISLIPAEAYRQKRIPNGTISVRLAGSPDQEPLSEGRVVEPSEKVEVSIIPREGYYVSGKNADEEGYRETLKYAKYVSDIDQIIEEHEIKKLVQITLDTADDYGQCTYEWNGEIISEDTAISVREEDKLVLKYQLTDENYEIMREEPEGVWDKIDKWRKDTFSGRKESVRIPITGELDGVTIKREDYIQIRKKGE